MLATYKVEIERVAAKAVADLPVVDQRRVVAAIRDLGVNPRPVGAVKLSGYDALRVRVGNFRVAYIVDEALRVVTVTRVAHRREVYQGRS